MRNSTRRFFLQDEKVTIETKHYTRAKINSKRETDQRMNHIPYRQSVHFLRPSHIDQLLFKETFFINKNRECSNYWGGGV